MTNTIELLTRFGFYATIAPYLGEIEVFARILHRLCKKTNQSLEINLKGYLGLQNHSYPGQYQVIKLLKKYLNSDDPNIFRKQTISLNMKLSYARILDFITKCGVHEMKILKNFSLLCMSKIKIEDRWHFNKFIAKTLPYGIANFTLKGQYDFEADSSSFASAFQKVTGKIFLINFKLNVNILKIIFENCYNAEEVIPISVRLIFW